MIQIIICLLSCLAQFGQSLQIRATTTTHSQAKNQLKARLRQKSQLQSKNLLKNQLKEQNQEKIENNGSQVSFTPQFDGVQFQSWGSFINTSSNEVINKDNIKFFINDNYAEEQARITNHEQNKEFDVNGAINIPNQFRFWMIIFKNQVYILNSRRGLSQRVVDVFNIADIVKQNWKDQIGQDHPPIEVSKQQLNDADVCLRLKFRVLPDNSNQKQDLRVICFENEKISNYFVKSVNFSSSITVEKYDPVTDGPRGNAAPDRSESVQVKNDPYSVQLKGLTEDEKPKENDEGHSQLTGSNNHSNAKSNIISDWSSCTVACGGGTQTQQRNCVQTSPDIPCSGQIIVKRPCNTQPCPKEAAEDVRVQGDLPAIIKTMRVSNDFWRYERCIINSIDLDLEIKDASLNNGPNKIKLQHRVVVNNQTLSIFDGMNYQKVVTVIPLVKLDVQHENNSECLSVKNTALKEDIYRLCAAQNYQGDKSELIQTFTERTIFFKEKCHKKMTVSQSSQKFKQIDDQIMETKATAIKEQTKYTQTQLETEDRDNQASANESNEIARITEIGMQQVQSEIAQQMRIQKEMEAQQLISKKKEELFLEKQKNTLVKILIQQEVDEDEFRNNTQDLVLEKSNIDHQKVKQREKEIKELITKLKQKSQDKMRQIKLLHEIETRDKKQEAEKIRLKAALKVVKSNFIGNDEHCKMNQEQKVKDEYCEKFIDDLDDIIKCKSTQEAFCYSCCEHEFGTKQKNRRMKCMTEQCGGQEKYFEWKQVQNN